MILRNPAAALKQNAGIDALIDVNNAFMCAMVFFNAVNAVNVFALYAKDAAIYTTVAAVIIMIIDVKTTLLR